MNKPKHHLDLYGLWFPTYTFITLDRKGYKRDKEIQVLENTDKCILRKEIILSF